jgi:protein TonB
MNFNHSVGLSPGGGASRWLGLAVVVGLHGAALIALLSYQPVREALGVQALMVEFIAPPAPPAPKPSEAAPKPPEVKVVKKTSAPPAPQSLIAAPAEAPSPMLAVPPAADPKPAPPVEAAAAPATAPPAPAGQPPVVSGVEYLSPPQPVYPPLARRMNEQGKVMLSVLVNVRGQPERVEIEKTSGSPRLDQAARTAVLEARFKPYLENGQPIAVRVFVPISFSLKDS